MKKSTVWRAKIKRAIEEREEREIAAAAPIEKQCRKCKFFSPIAGTITNIERLYETGYCRNRKARFSSIIQITYAHKTCPEFKCKVFE